MSRRAVIFGYPGEPDQQNYCPGVELDIENYHQFLLSPNGGWWNEEEIEVLGIGPSLTSVRTAVEKLKTVDYGFVIFSGHGYYVKSRDTTVLEVRKNVELDAVELNTGSPKQTLLLDCCRVLIREVTLAEQFAKSAAAASIVNGVRCRQEYDRRIGSCPKGRVVMYACNIDETAVDTGRGGRYSLSVLSGARDWARTNSSNPGILSVVEAHALAYREVVRRSGGSQTPQIEKPRSEPYYPFAVDAW